MTQKIQWIVDHVGHLAEALAHVDKIIGEVECTENDQLKLVAQTLRGLITNYPPQYWGGSDWLSIAARKEQTDGSR